MGQTLTIWTIYERPQDYPDGYVVRPWIIGRDGIPHPGAGIQAGDLATARAAIPDGLIRMERADDDEPQILETWI